MLFEVEFSPFIFPQIHMKSGNIIQLCFSVIFSQQSSILHVIQTISEINLPGLLLAQRYHLLHGDIHRRIRFRRIFENLADPLSVLNIQRVTVARRRTARLKLPMT